jgi:polyphosphate kinase
VFIGSADLMHRNLDRRVETLVRITDPDAVTELLDLLVVSMADTTSSWHLQSDDRWERHATGPDGASLTDLQALLVARHSRRRLGRR